MTDHTFLRSIVDKAIGAVAPDGAVLGHMRLENEILYVDEQKYDLSKYKRIIVLGAGKGAAPMAAAIESLLGKRINDGLIIVKYDHELPLKYIKLACAAHPVPDQSGVENAWKIVSMAEQASADDLVICLFTGGASALTPALVKGISLEDLRTMTSLLLECGATIHEINTIRKHLSAFSGGRLVQAAAPARVISLIVSDVVGDNLDVIASGPTVPDPSTFANCGKIIDKFNLWDKIPSAIGERLRQGLAGNIDETPKKEDRVFENVQTVLIATLSQALEAAKQFTTAHGYNSKILCENMTGEAKERITELVAEAKKTLAERKNDEKICLLAGGETTVTIHGSGLGGRNQEMALVAGILLADQPKISLVCVGTDGTDGPTDAAGGFADSNMVSNAKAKKLDLQAYLNNNDSYHALSQVGYILKTGPTRTNVMDMVAILID